MASDKKNILIVGYPKSGTVWATRLVAQLLDCPSMGFWGFEENKFAAEGLDRISNFSCYQSHHIYSELFDVWDKNIYKVIYIVRDPRDIIISGSFHFHFYHSLVNRFIRGRRIEHTILGKAIKLLDLRLMPARLKIKLMQKIMLNGDPSYPILKHPWDQHVKSYLNQNVLIIKYEDLLLHSFDTSKKILAYLSYEKSEVQILKDINSQSFSVKKEVFKKMNDQTKDKHLRRGEAGQWKQNLSESELRDIEGHFSNIMGQFGYEIER